jgi:lysophospholipase L1-like esterase
LNIDLVNADKAQHYYLASAGNGFTIKVRDASEDTGAMIDKLPAPLKKITNLSLLEYLWIRRKQMAANAQPAAVKPASKTKLSQEMVDWVIQQLKACYPEAVVLYIPTIDYYNLKTPQGQAESLLTNSCIKKNVKMINMRSIFLEHFKKTRQPASGFYNTTPGVGHTNAVGHRLMAEALAQHFSEKVK